MIFTENNNYSNHDNTRKNEITYDEGWQSVEFTEYPHRPQSDDGTDHETDDDKAADNVDNNVKKPNGQLVITVRLIACIVIALAAFALKAIGGEAYSSVRSWYYDNLNNSAIFDGDSYTKLSQLFGATSDEAENS